MPPGKNFNPFKILSLMRWNKCIVLSFLMLRWQDGSFCWSIFSEILSRWIANFFSLLAGFGLRSKVVPNPLAAPLLYRSCYMCFSEETMFLAVYWIASYPPYWIIPWVNLKLFIQNMEDSVLSPGLLVPVG